MSDKYLHFDLYKSKYLKYKNKYLTLKNMYGGVGMPNLPNDIQEYIRKTAQHKDYSLVSKMFNSSNELNKENVDTWFNEYKNGFDINYIKKHSISKVFDNKIYNVIDLSIKQKVFDDDKLLEILNSLGNFYIIGNLCLRNNNITKIPIKFTYIKVHGILDLRGNNITEVPENFSNIVSDNLILDYRTERAILSQEIQQTRMESRKRKKIYINSVCEYLQHLQHCEVKLDNTKIWINDNLLSDEETMNLCIHIHVENSRIDDITDLASSGKLSDDEVSEVEKIRQVNRKEERVIDGVNNNEQNNGGPMRNGKLRKKSHYNPQYKLIQKRFVIDKIPYYFSNQQDNISNRYGIDFNELFYQYRF